MTDWNPDDPDATRVHYDLSGWTIDQQAELASELAEAEVPHTWDGTDLIVPEEAEQATDVIIEAVEERLGIEGDGPLAGHPADDLSMERLVLDLGGLAFVDSSGLRVFVTAREALSNRGAVLALRNPSPNTRRLLDIAGLGEIIEVE